MGSDKKAFNYLAIVFVCVAVYFKCLFFGVTNVDDEVLIAGNIPYLRNFANILKVFTTDAFYQIKSIDLYRPLQSATFILDAQWGQSPVFTAHLTNLILHTLTCLILFELLNMLGFRERIAFLGALVYAVHYLMMTAVAWLPARGDLLLALTAFLSLVLLIKSLVRASWSAIGLHLGFFTLALLAKESAVVLPILFAVYLWTHNRGAALTRRHLVLPVYYGIAVTGYWLLKGAAVSDSSDERGVMALLRNSHQLPEMVGKFYLPVNMSTLPAVSLMATGCGIVVIVLLVVCCFTSRRLRQRRTLFYPAWFLLLILPAMTYYPNFYSFSNEHVDNRSYLICFGLLLLNCRILQEFELDRHRFFMAAAFVVLCYLAVSNVVLSPSYRNPERFAWKAIEMGSNSALAYSNYGAEKLLQGDELEALRYLNRSLRIVPKFMPALHHRARIFSNRGMYREALSDLDVIFSVDPAYDAADYALRGSIRARLLDNTGAEQDLLTALKLHPGFLDAQIALGSLYQAVGRVDAACLAWEGVVKQGNTTAAELIARYCR